jgi:hypothetical protein
VAINNQYSSIAAAVFYHDKTTKTIILVFFSHRHLDRSQSGLSVALEIYRKNFHCHAQFPRNLSNPLLV